MTDQTTTTPERWPNTLPEQQRNNMWTMHGYNSGEIRDGHAIERYECPEDGFGVFVHPPECEKLHDEGTDHAYISHYGCPLEELAPNGPRSIYADGEDACPDLPPGSVTPIVWGFTSGWSWTDYGWEGDSEAWWRLEESSR